MNIQQFLDKLELLRAKGRQKPTLTEDQKSELKKHPKAARTALKKKYLEEAQKEVENWIFGMLQEMEADIKASGLPPEAVQALLNALSNVKDARFVASPQVLDKVEDLKREAEKLQQEQKNQSTAQNDLSPLPTAAAAITLTWGVIAFETKNKKYYKEKLIHQLAESTPDADLVNLPAEESGFAHNLPPRPARGVGRKQRRAAWKLWRSGAHREGEQPPPPPAASGNAYSQLHYDTLQSQAQDLNAYLLKDVQAKRKTDGKPPVADNVILANLAAAYPAQQRLAQKAVYQVHPDLKEKHQAQTLEADSMDLLKGVIRQERAVRQAKAKILEKKLKHILQAHKEALRQTPDIKAPHLITIQTELNTHRQVLAHLGLVMDNFDKVLAQNNLTATALMKDRARIMSQVMALNVTGLRTRSPLKQRLGTLEQETTRLPMKRMPGLAHVKRRNGRQIA